ncbi:MAG: FAD-dependent thymidylate synthase [Anaerolineales bacterium]|nr:FAD-dependent thymidylate synthase [Anaerolineales bacterium]
MTETFKREIYLLRPKKLSPETIAVTFAKTSRSPLSFREIAAELSDEQSSEFHEKWVVGYGHASVAEHAVLHIAFENVSRLAIECIESNRLASYTEKSTRYQKWDLKGYCIPEEVRGTQYESLYTDACDALFSAYQESLEPVKAVVQEMIPQREGESDARWDGRIRSEYVDACRFLLPAASLANVGMTANARTFEHAIRKMLSHPLEEVRSIGEQVKAVARQETPTLVKYAERVPYQIETQKALEERAGALPAASGGEMLELLAYDQGAEMRVLAAALYTQSGCSFVTALEHVRSLDAEAQKSLAHELLGRLEKFDVPLRAVEHAVYTFDAIMDQGAYFELKRHRMMTQTPQILRADLGYAVPRKIAQAGFESRYREAMDQAAEAYSRLAEWNPHVAAYLVPNGFNRRVLMTLNLREVFHFCELRAERNAHFSIRRIAMRMAEMVQSVHPLLAAYLRMPEEETWGSIEVEHFTQV